MEKKEYLGIDVSKEKVDVWTYKKKKQAQFENNKTGLKKLKKWLENHEIKREDLLICFEHTGMYALPLHLFCEDEGFDYVLVSGLQVKRSLGIQRGKNDQIDSYRLAEYAYLKRDKLSPTKLASRLLVKLKYLLSFRSRLVRVRAGFKGSIKEYKAFLKLNNKDVIIKSQLRLIEEYTKHIDQVEKEIKALLDNDKGILQQYQLASSVKGVGMITAAYMIAYTNCFKDFKKWRSFASYVGSAPFEYTSGTSVKGKTRISHYANKTIKAILTNAALAAIKNDPEINRYYQRRLQEGKHRKIVINNIRNKLISRVFATVNRGTPFVNVAKFAA